MIRNRKPSRYGLVFLRAALNVKDNKELFCSDIHVAGLDKDAFGYVGATAFVRLLNKRKWGMVPCGEKGFIYARENIDRVFVYPTLKAAVFAFKLGARGETK